MNTDKTYAETIASEYASKEESKVIALRKLDKKAKRPAEIFAYTFGLISSLILGAGMCLSMKVIGEGMVMMIIGIVIGIVGIGLISLTYPIYKKILAKGKAKYAADIISLANEIAEEK